MGYVWLTIGVNPLYVDTGIRLESDADLCGRCLDDVATDVLYMTGNDHALEAADPLEDVYKRQGDTCEENSSIIMLDTVGRFCAFRLYKR